MNIVELTIPQPSEGAVTDAQKALTLAKAFHITNNETAMEMQQMRQRINTRIKELNAERVSMTKPLDESKARIMAFFKRPIDFLEQALTHCDDEIVVHNRRVEDARREAQRKAEEEAAKERRRLAAIAEEARQKAEAEQRERDRLAAIARKQAEDEQRRLRAEADAARRAGDAEAQRRAEAERLRVKAEQEAAARETQRRNDEARAAADAKAATFEERAATTVAPVVTVEPIKVAGVSMRDNWTYRIKDPAKIKPAFMTPDTVKIGKLVKALRLEAAEQIGEGVEIYNEQVVASKRSGA